MRTFCWLVAVVLVVTADSKGPGLKTRITDKALNYGSLPFFHSLIQCLSHFQSLSLKFRIVLRIINIHTVWLILMFRADTECDVEKGIYANLSTTYVIKVYIFTSCRRRFGYSFQTNHRTCDSRPARKFRGCFVRPHRVRYISFCCLSNRMFSHV